MAAHRSSGPVETGANGLLMKTIPGPVLEEPRGVDPFRLAQPNTATQSMFGDRLYFPIKRVVDLIFATVFLIAISPVLLLVSIAIFIESPGPIFYRQWRYGHLGKPFKIIKFRSMRLDADKMKAELADKNEAVGAIFKIRRDPRVTRVGRVIRKLSIDEAPQVLNVVRGQMSLVGPRPMFVDELDMSNPMHADRQRVKPGLLCFREVMGRSNLSFDEWLELDLKYIRERSLRVDIWILLRAIPSVILGRGAF